MEQSLECSQSIRLRLTAPVACSCSCSFCLWGAQAASLLAPAACWRTLFGKACAEKAQASCLCSPEPHDPNTPILHDLAPPLASTLLQGVKCQSSLIPCPSPAFSCHADRIPSRLFKA